MAGQRRGSGGVTIQDVARAAGVSAMTVSRVVNGGSNVSAGTREAVRAAVETLQYRPNPAARILAAGGAAQIGLLYANPSAGYLGQLLLGALAGARTAGCHLVVELCEGEDAAAQFDGTDVRGVILPPPLSESPAILAALRAAELPFVTIGAGGGEGDVGIDDAAAAAAMTRHLLDLGHRDIAFIRGDPGVRATRERWRGFAATMAQAGVAEDAIVAADGDFTVRSGIAATESILERARPTAIFASNDDMAAAAIGVAHRRGLAVPDDISIVGFDDTAIATSLWPELTTIRQPIAELAASALDRLLAGLRGRDAADALTLPHELIVRASSGPLPRGAIQG